MAASIEKLLNLRIVHSSKKHTASILFLHGSGDSGTGIINWLNNSLGRSMSFNHIRLLFPTAQERPYTPADGQLSTVWYDRKDICNQVSEDLQSIDATADKLNQLIDLEVKSGIPENRIIIGGFSMGGGMALHMAYRYRTTIAGVFALSSFLNRNSIIYKNLRCNKPANIPSLFQCHGIADALIPIEWGTETYKQLKGTAVNCVFHSFEHLEHDLGKTELEMLMDWIKEKLPDI